MKSLAVFLLTMMFLPLYGQTGQLTGKIIDAKTLEALPFASVFINNSTMGTSANASGDFVLNNVPQGPVELVYSFLGYQPYTSKQVIQSGNAVAVTIKLVPLDNQLSEVEIKASRDKAWEKHLKKFEKIFLGDDKFATGCKILNPWVIDFTGNGNFLVAKASAPLEIENTMIGYRLSFYLKDFKYTGDTYSIIGNTRFQEMTAIHRGEASQWAKNREAIYLGSTRHLMKAIVDKRISGEGFKLYTDRVANTPRTDNFSFELQHNIIPYDTSSIVTKSATANEYLISLKGKIEVHNIYSLSRSSFYKDLSNALSWLEVKKSIVRVNEQGVLLNPAEVTISGDMSTARVSHFLPLDYSSKHIIAVQPRINLSAKRLQEKVYVVTDKSYYYPSETVWLSAFMNYQVPGMADTLSRILYIDFINANRTAVGSQMMLIDSGRAAGSFEIGKEISPGNYVLRGYTQWMRNYGIDALFYKSITVLDPYDKADVNPVELTLDDNLKVHTDKQVYHRREKVLVSISLEDEDNQKGNVSVSVTNANPIAELPNIIKDYPFEKDLPNGMLSRFTYPIEHALRFDGVYQNRKGKAEKTTFTMVSDDYKQVHNITTDLSGRFSLKDIAFYDSARFAIQLESGKVTWNKKDVPDLPARMPIQGIPVIKVASPFSTGTYESENSTVLLKEVVVKSTREEGHFENRYGKPDISMSAEVLSEASPNLASAIQQKIPGFKLSYQNWHWFLLRERGEFTANAAAEPVLYIDNVQASSVNETTGDRLYAMSTSLVDHIEVMGMINANLGANGSHGLIAVFTKKTSAAVSKELQIVKLKGFDRVKLFAGPDYTLTSDAKEEDKRSTLYWNPMIKLNGGAPKEQVSFFTSDLTGIFRIVVEGVTLGGAPVRAEASIVVE